MTRRIPSRPDAGRGRTRPDAAGRGGRGGVLAGFAGCNGYMPDPEWVAISELPQPPTRGAPAFRGTRGADLQAARVTDAGLAAFDRTHRKDSQNQNRAFERGTTLA